MNRIVFICPYFGELGKEQFKFWLRSCEYNSTVDFLMLLDDEEALAMDMPQNVHPVKMIWDECRDLIKNQFDFELSIEYAYKICDFRPAFGIIFAEYIKEYDFWGHMDISDTILGDLRKFISEEMLNEYDKIHIYGHLTLYRNTDENNNRFRIPSKSGMTIETIFTTEENMCFDDMYQPASINKIFLENEFPIIERVENLVADVLPWYWRLGLAEDAGKSVPRVFEWDNGKLVELTISDNEKVAKREIGYVHFQKRKISDETSPDSKHYYFVPNRFIDAEKPLTAQDIREYAKDKLYFEPYKARIKRLRWYLKHPDALKRKLSK